MMMTLILNQSILHQSSTKEIYMVLKKINLFGLLKTKIMKLETISGMDSVMVLISKLSVLHQLSSKKVY